MTRLIEVLISLAIVAALFLVISFVLPSSRHLTEQVETNRKMTIVYDTLNSLRRFKDWNPLVLRDPRMQLKLSGPDSGVGARLDYVSKDAVARQGQLGNRRERIRARASPTRSPIPQRGHDKRTDFHLQADGPQRPQHRNHPDSTTSTMAGTCLAAMPACTSPATSATT